MTSTDITVSPLIDRLRREKRTQGKWGRTDLEGWVGSFVQFQSACKIFQKPKKIAEGGKFACLKARNTDQTLPQCEKNGTKNMSFLELHRLGEGRKKLVQVRLRGLLVHGRH